MTLRGARVTLRPVAEADLPRLVEILRQPEVREWWGDYRHAGMDIFLAPDRHGQGLGTDALRTLARHLIDDRGHHRLTIDPAVANKAAIRAYEKLGFRPVGVMRQVERSPDGEWRDGLLMDLLADELTA